MKQATLTALEGVFDFLMFEVSQAKQGSDSYKLALPHARTVLRGAEKPLRKLGLYEKTASAIEAAERLIIARELDKADELLLAVAREIYRERKSHRSKKAKAH